ncbi:hypothetical protein KSP39_PZI014257 [Platanthera zijinensis]|uniref:CCHC-type domain-containing protein n=1 Tax=Platanthera zijinensis TaxID=2320716 RepID=A0AAP0BB73_9ASPA
MARRPSTRSTPLSEGKSSGAQNDAVIESLRQSSDSLSRQIVDMRAQIQSLVVVVARQTQEVQGPTGGLTVPPPPAPLKPPVVVPAEMAFISQFQRLSPPTYDGKADFMVIDDWLISIEEMFSYSGITDDQRVMIAAYQLKDLAKSWWLREKESLVAGCSWEVFKEMLLRKFLPSVERDRLMNDFLHLKQRQLTVGEYEIEFSKLSRFAPGLVIVEADRVKRFLGGLRSKVQQLTSAYGSETYAGVVEAALMVEDIETAKSRGQQMRKDKRKSVEEKKPQVPGSASGKKSKVVCSFCGRSGHLFDRCFKKAAAQKKEQVHAIQGAPRRDVSCSVYKRPRHDAAQFWSKDKVCYQCGQKGHINSRCPQVQPALHAVPLQALPPPQHVDKGKGKLNVISSEEAQALTQVISGKFKVKNCWARVLFDSGATHSFVARAFVERYRLTLDRVRDTFSIKFPSSESLLSDLGVLDFPVLLGDFLAKAYLKMIDLEDFDVILGMDWLSKYDMVIQCKGKRLDFIKDNVSVVGTAVSVPHLEEIPVVRGFADVFPDDHPGLPPDWDVEFVIYLELGTHPIAKASYLMAPRELEEL